MKEKVKEKTAEIIRIITIPPIEALVMLLILYGAKREDFGNLKHLLMAVIFLSVIPICAYPMASGKRRGESDRNKQRNMAFAFNFLSYLAEFWASVALKRHTIQEYFGGTVVASLVFAGIS